MSKDKDIIRGFKSLGVGKFFAILGCSMLIALLIGAALAGLAAFGHFRGNFDLDDRVVGLLSMLGGMGYFVRRLKVIGQSVRERESEIDAR